MSAERQPLGAWSRRRAAVQAEADALVKADEEAVVAEQHAALAEKTEEEVLAELDLPVPEDMQAGDDFGAFMKSTVPAALRNRALRTLWRSNPLLANVDMLVDYGEDFTGASDPVGAISTIYRVGKGMLADKEDEPEGEVVKATAPEPKEEAVDHAEVATAPLPEPEVRVALAPRRRMRFEFAEQDGPASAGMEPK